MTVKGERHRRTGWKFGFLSQAFLLPVSMFVIALLILIALFHGKAREDVWEILNQIYTEALHQTLFIGFAVMVNSLALSIWRLRKDPIRGSGDWWLAYSSEAGHFYVQGCCEQTDYWPFGEPAQGMIPLSSPTTYVGVTLNYRPLRYLGFKVKEKQKMQYRANDGKLYATSYYFPRMSTLLYHFWRPLWWLNSSEWGRRGSR